MILKGNQRAHGRELALHLLNVEDNEHAAIHEIRGFLADDLIGAFKEAEAISLGTKCQQYLFSLSLSPPKSANVPVIEFEKAITDIERRLGLAGQPRAIVFHEKKGRRHAHCVWSRIDVETMRAINLPHYKRRLNDISRELFVEHGWDMPPGYKKDGEPDPASYSHAEAGQSKRSKQDPEKLKLFFKACWVASDSRAAFAAALLEQGFMLARGDRRGFVAVSVDGEVYSLSRWCGVKAKDLRSRFGSHDDLPAAEEAIAQLQQSQNTQDPAFAVQINISEEFEERRKLLVSRQRDERTQLKEGQEQRRIAEICERNERLPTGLRAAWMRLTGRYESLCAVLEKDAKSSENRCAQEMMALIDRHIAERQALEQEFSRASISNALDQVFSDAALNEGRRIYRPDPRQPLILPPDDALFTKEQIRSRPDLVLDVLSEKQGSFTRTDILKKLADVFNDPLELRLAADGVLQSEKLLRLPEGKVETFTTLDYRNARSRLEACASNLAGSGGFAVSKANIDRAIAHENKRLRNRLGAELSNEQVAAIRHVLQPNQLSAVVGLAGVGKSTLLSVARQAWEQQGYRVHGATLAGKAADSLQSASGIPSRTLASLEASWKSGYEPVSHGDIVVIDETGMVGTRQLERIAHQLRDRGCKLVLVGDPEQLQPIEAGTPFKDIVQKNGAASLTEIRRQKLAWQREASLQFANGQARVALQAYANHGAVHTGRDRDGAIFALVEDYLADRAVTGDAGSRLALAHRRKDVHAINQAIKSALLEREGVKPETLFMTDNGPRAFAEGDRILFTRNDGTLNVRNGMLGTVSKLDGKSLTVRLDPDESGKGRSVTFEPKFFSSFDHGFAVSIHRSQGCTVDRSFVLSSQTLDKHLTYVAMTRHREEAKFYSAPEIQRYQSRVLGYVPPRSTIGTHRSRSMH